MMSKQNLQSLTDDEFANVLRGRAKDSSWTVAQLIEYERRGSSFLDSEPILRDAIDEHLADYQTRLASIFDPLRESFSNLIPEALKTSIDLPKFDFTIPTLPSLVESYPAISEETLSSAAMRQYEDLEVRQAVESGVGVLGQIEKNTSWTHRHTVGLVATLIGSIAAVVAAVTGLLMVFR